MLLDLDVGRLARINCSLNGFDLSVDACLDVDFLALRTVFDIEEYVPATRVLSHDAEHSAVFTRTYRITSSRLPTDYCSRPCR